MENVRRQGLQAFHCLAAGKASFFVLSLITCVCHGGFLASQDLSSADLFSAARAGARNFQALGDVLETAVRDVRAETSLLS